MVCPMMPRILSVCANRGYFGWVGLWNLLKKAPIEVVRLQGLSRYNPEKADDVPSPRLHTGVQAANFPEIPPAGVLSGACHSFLCVAFSCPFL